MSCPAWQVKDGTYNPEANLALLRHYQFAPERGNINCIATMLIKAQMQLPSHDFTQLLQLIPERVQVTCVAPAEAHNLIAGHSLCTVKSISPFTGALRIASYQAVRLQSAHSSCIMMSTLSHM